MTGNHHRVVDAATEDDAGAGATAAIVAAGGEQDRRFDAIGDQLTALVLGCRGAGRQGEHANNDRQPHIGTPKQSI